MVNLFSLPIEYTKKLQQKENQHEKIYDEFNETGHQMVKYFNKEIVKLQNFSDIQNSTSLSQVANSYPGGADLFKPNEEQLDYYYEQRKKADLEFEINSVLGSGVLVVPQKPIISIMKEFTHSVLEKRQKNLIKDNLPGIKDLEVKLDDNNLLQANLNAKTDQYLLDQFQSIRMKRKLKELNKKETTNATVDLIYTMNEADVKLESVQPTKEYPQNITGKLEDRKQAIHETLIEIGKTQIEADKVVAILFDDHLEQESWITQNDLPPIFQKAGQTLIQDLPISQASVGNDNLDHSDFNFFRDLGPLSRINAKEVKANKKQQKHMISQLIDIDPNQNQLNEDMYLLALSGTVPLKKLMQKMTAMNKWTHKPQSPDGSFQSSSSDNNKSRVQHADQSFEQHLQRESFKKAENGESNKQPDSKESQVKTDYIEPIEETQFHRQNLRQPTKRDSPDMNYYGTLTNQRTMGQQELSIITDQNYSAGESMVANDILQSFKDPNNTSSFETSKDPVNKKKIQKENIQKQKDMEQAQKLLNEQMEKDSMNVSDYSQNGVEIEQKIISKLQQIDEFRKARFQMGQDVLGPSPIKRKVSKLTEMNKQASNFDRIKSDLTHKIEQNLLDIISLLDKLEQLEQQRGIIHTIDNQTIMKASLLQQEEDIDIKIKNQFFHRLLREYRRIRERAKMIQLNDKIENQIVSNFYERFPSLQGSPESSTRKKNRDMTQSSYDVGYFKESPPSQSQQKKPINMTKQKEISNLSKQSSRKDRTAQKLNLFEIEEISQMKQGYGVNQKQQKKRVAPKPASDFWEGMEVRKQPIGQSSPNQKKKAPKKQKPVVSQDIPATEAWIGTAGDSDFSDDWS